jgi:chromate transporter
MSGEPGAPAPPRAPTRAEAFGFWWKLGWISFGGPAGQIAIMHRELRRRAALDLGAAFLHALNYCMLLPGPEATQLAVYLGWLLHRTWGGVVAGVLFVLPSLFVLIALSWIYMRFGTVPAIAGALGGVKPVIVAIVLHAAWRIGRRTLRHASLWAIAIVAFLALQVFGVPFPAIVLGAALAGVVLERVVPQAFSSANAHAPHGTAPAPAVIDDDTPTPAARALFPPATRRDRRGVRRDLGRCLRGRARARYDLRGDGVAVHQGRARDVRRRVCGAPVHRPAGRRAAGLAHGGADDRRPRARRNHAGTAHHGRRVRRLRRRVDPAALGTGAEVAAGIVGACVATFFTFLPSFLFILAGGPLVEATHGDARVTAPLTGITAAVVGVVVSLAVFFGAHVFWPEGFAATRAFDGLDSWAVGIFAASAVALFAFRAGVIPLVLAGALAGTRPRRAVRR